MQIYASQKKSLKIFILAPQYPTPQLYHWFNRYAVSFVNMLLSVTYNIYKLKNYFWFVNKSTDC